MGLVHLDKRHPMKKSTATTLDLTFDGEYKIRNHRRAHFIYIYFAIRNHLRGQFPNMSFLGLKLQLMKYLPFNVDGST